MPYLFAPPAQPVIPVQDERYEFFPVRRIYCATDNYAADGDPAVFMKPADAIVPVADGQTKRVALPEDDAKLEFGVELAACLSRGGRNMSLEQAEDAVWGWCVGVGIRRAVRDARGPWEKTHSLDGSAVVSHLRPAYRTPMPAPADIYLYRNNERAQSGRTSQMKTSPYALIAEISKHWELMPGDVVFTGTPSGAVLVRRGDVLLAGVNGVGMLRIEAC